MACVYESKDYSHSGQEDLDHINNVDQRSEKHNNPLEDGEEERHKDHWCSGQRFNDLSNVETASYRDSSRAVNGYIKGSSSPQKVGDSSSQMSRVSHQGLGLDVEEHSLCPEHDDTHMNGALFVECHTKQKGNLLDKSILNRMTKSRNASQNTGVVIGWESRASFKDKDTFLRTPSHFHQRLADFDSETSDEEVDPPKIVQYSTMDIPPSRIEAAINNVSRIKASKREDRLLGVPRNFKNLQRKTGSASSEQQKQKDKTQESLPRIQSSKKTKIDPAGYAIPGWYKFPKNKDFIQPEGHKPRATSGLTWRVSSSGSSRRSRPTVEDVPKRINSGKTTIPGKMCTSKYPVTEAMRALGTSVEQRRGRLLKSADWNVIKIWPRAQENITPCTLPIQMANEDVRLYENMMKRMNAFCIH